MIDWPQIVEQHGGIVWKTVYRLVGNDADAADCFQETFADALEYSRKHTIRNWPGLLKQMATAQALDCLGARSLAAARNGRLMRTMGAVKREIGPLATVESTELLERVRRELAELPRQQAEACCLRFLEDFSYEEVADHLNLTVNHVGVLLNRARHALRERLRDLVPRDLAGQPLEQNNESFR
jgi:RNA polymerase sigma-70 factor (ECF subfamily)